MGDCAERFGDFQEDIIKRKIAHIELGAKIIENALGRKVIKVARIAG
jgi:3-deoxy-D-arabino-heptulosonate 7-phosphate (DAHP) synthase class II